MMYQRAAMWCLSVSLNCRASGEVEHHAHDPAEELVDAEEEQCQDHHHDADEDRGFRGFRPSGPHHLAAFGADLAEELHGVGLGHLVFASKPEIVSETCLPP